MNVLCREFKGHYHFEMPHPGLDNELIDKPPAKKRKKSKPKFGTIRFSDVRCHELLGGLLKSYSRRTA